MGLAFALAIDMVNARAATSRSATTSTAQESSQTQRPS